MTDNGLTVVGVGGAFGTEEVTVATGASEDDDEGTAVGRALSWQPHRASATATAIQRTIESWQGYGASVAQRTPACVWRATPALITALDERFGEPVDAYVNGSQTWLRDDGPGGLTVEWRLHPVAGYRKPPALDTYEVFAAVALALETGAEPPAPVELLWDGLEVFPAYGDEVEPAPLAAAAEAAVGIEPDRAGLVDHDAVADAWERSGGATSIIDALFAQLSD